MEAGFRLSQVVIFLLCNTWSTANTTLAAPATVWHSLLLRNKEESIVHLVPSAHIWLRQILCDVP
eukprot:7349365-Ditylum_brightwellii.AAC.1